VAVLGDRRLRILASVWVLGGLVMHHQLADWEHLFSFIVGFGLGALLGRPTRCARSTRRASAFRVAGAAAGAVYLATIAAIAPAMVPLRTSVTLTGASAFAYGVPDGTTLGSPRLERVTYDSPALGTSRTAYVLLPPGYDSTARSYPVVELLHGSPGAPLDMFNRLRVAEAEQSGLVIPFVAVAPDGNGPGATETDFADTATSRMGTAVSADLRAAIEARFRTDGHWGVMGISSGGFGATYLASSHPIFYQAACSLSGFFLAADPAFRATNPTVRDQSSPLLHAYAGNPPVLVIAGANDPDGRASALRYASALDAAKQPNRLVIADRAGHDWELWNRQLVPCLQWVLQPPTTRQT
jgi:S-formylglutathione hydrolase FrmB